MPFEAATLSHLEDALSGCFQYHRQLDDFLRRSGVPSDVLVAARTRAEKRNADRPGRYPKAPKRFVAQELVNLLYEMGAEGDRVVSGLLPQFLNGEFPDASPEGRAAAEFLQAQAEKDAKRKERAQREQEERRREADEEKQREHEAARTARDAARDRFKGALEGLIAEGDAQKRGYMFEKFLNDYFELEALAPRGAFKLLGEQIDGSFAFDGKVHLLEAKWQKAPVSGQEFGAFQWKIEGKSVDTRGLYVSVNGYSAEALQALKGKGAAKFVCIDGAHLFRSLMPGQDLSRVLTAVWRHVGETGEAYLPVSNM